jgi:hypothetical protein
MAIRTAYTVVYGALAALGAALLARPAELWIRGLGLWAPTLPWRVPAGWTAPILLVALAATVARLAAAFARRQPLPRTAYASFLATVAAATAVRSLGEPVPPLNPDAAILAALRRSAEFLDASYARAGAYEPDLRALHAVLGALPPPGFVSTMRPLRFTARLTHAASVVAARDGPGTISVAISPDRQQAWLSATTLRNGSAVLLSATVEARAGTHSDAGGDAALPVYPRTTAEFP